MASLPSGYTKLEYIESSGTQYIDTGFIPNQDSAVHIVCQPTVASDWQGIFGARSATNVGEFGVDIPAGTTLRSVYGTNSVTTTVSTVATKLDIYKNKNVCTINGAVLTNSTQTFSSGYPIWIFDKNTAGAKWNPCSMKLYSCKVYDNGTLVRDFIPCKNASGTLGLWDNVNSVFYANAGTGVFIAGPEVPISGSEGEGKHKTLIDGTGHEIKIGRVLIAGTGYDIKKGRTLIGGTGYDIKFGTPVAELAEGTIIKINESGSPVEFYVAKHNYESGLNGVGRTLVVRKDCYSTRSFTSGNAKHFPESDICTWLNETYIGLLDNSVQEVITSTTFKAWVTGTKVTTAEKKIFLLSATELGVVSNLAYVEGEKLDISDLLIPANLNGEAIGQWTRSSIRNNDEYVLVINADGTLGRVQSWMTTIGVRPIFALPETMGVDNDFILLEP